MKGIPVAVVVIGGGPLDIQAVKDNPNVGAIVWAGYPGRKPTVLSRVDDRPCPFRKS